LIISEKIIIYFISITSSILGLVVALFSCFIIKFMLFILLKILLLMWLIHFRCQQFINYQGRGAIIHLIIIRLSSLILAWTYSLLRTIFWRNLTNTIAYLLPVSRTIGLLLLPISLFSTQKLILQRSSQLLN